MASATFSGVSPPASRTGYFVARRFARPQSARRPVPPKDAEFMSGVAASSRNDKAAPWKRICAAENFASARKGFMKGICRAQVGGKGEDSSPWSFNALYFNDFSNASHEAAA